MISEIYLHLALTKPLIPHLLVSGSLSFILDLNESIQNQTSTHHDLAIESGVNVAQTVSKLFINTNPKLVNDHQKYSSIKLMCKRLLSPKAHHELLLYEGLMALINVSTCVSEWAEEIIVMECGIETNEVRTLYQVIT